MTATASLLRQSRAAHAEYHRLAAVYTGSQWEAGDAEAARDALANALALRVDADAADPDHADPGWRADKVPHADLMAFYTKYLETH